MNDLANQIYGGAYSQERQNQQAIVPFANQLANQDYDRAGELARGFEAEGPRAIATIAIARAVLEPKKPAAAKSAAKN